MASPALCGRGARGRCCCRLLRPGRSNVVFFDFREAVGTEEETAEVERGLLQSQAVAVI